ncbi:hypothetical protein H1R20_g5551, partial [Candolleomyces eurysporus]
MTALTKVTVEGEKDEIYYWDTVKFLVEACIFKVPRNQFVIGSTYFAKKLESTKMSDNKGDGAPVVPEGATASQFRVFLKLLFPIHTTSTTLQFTKDEWLTILELSTRWHFHEFRKLAKEHLDPQIDDPIERIVLGRAAYVPAWVLDGYESLVTRPECISEQESERIGHLTTVRLYILRHERCVESCASRFRKELHKLEQMERDHMSAAEKQMEKEKQSEEERFREDEMGKRWGKEQRMKGEEVRRTQEEEQRVQEKEERWMQEEEERQMQEQEQRIQEEEQRMQEEEQRMQEEERRMQEQEEMKRKWEEEERRIQAEEGMKRKWQEEQWMKAEEEQRIQEEEMKQKCEEEQQIKAEEEQRMKEEQRMIGEGKRRNEEEERYKEKQSYGGEGIHKVEEEAQRLRLLNKRQSKIQNRLRKAERDLCIAGEELEKRLVASMEAERLLSDFKEARPHLQPLLEGHKGGPTLEGIDKALLEQEEAELFYLLEEQARTQLLVVEAQERRRRMEEDRQRWLLMANA